MQYKSGKTLIRCASLAFSAFLFSIGAAQAAPEGNTKFESFPQVKKILLTKVYYDHRRTVYCDVPFDRQRRTRLPAGFTAPDHEYRAGRIEIEHIVPAENFGRTFEEWRTGTQACRKDNGKIFRGRKCAEQASREYRLIQADMYNLYPAVGAVNALRSNFSFTEFDGSVPPTFGTCSMKIYGRHAEPPEAVKGVVARTYKYMAKTYPRIRLSEANRRLFDAWDREHPVTQWECTRTRRIKAIQGNENRVVEAACEAAGL